MSGQRLPPRAAPLLYLGIAHAAATAAAVLLVIEPRAALGALRDPRLLAVVHLLTVGWITGSILGSLYLVPPMALRSRIAESAADIVAALVFLIAVSLLAAGFWSIGVRGLVGGAVLVVVVLGWVGARRIVPAIVSAPVSGIKAHFLLAFVNALLGIGLGMAMANGLVVPLARAPYGLLAAHAVLLVVGWGLMMVMGAGTRLIPMILPSAIPAGGRVAATAWIGELGVLALALGQALGFGELAAAGGIATAVALGLFLWIVGWMLRNPRPRARGVPRPDLPAAHVLLAMACLLAAGALSVARLAASGALATPELLVLGVLVLLGCLGQMIVGVVQRLAPWLAWLWAYAASGYRRLPPLPYAIPSARVQWAVFVAWQAAVVLLAAGAWLGSTVCVRLGAIALGIGVLGSGRQLHRACRLALGWTR